MRNSSGSVIASRVGCHLRWLQEASWIEVGRVGDESGLELGLQLVGLMDRELRVFDDEPPTRRKCDGGGNGAEPRLIQLVVVMRSMPPLAVVTVGDIKLRPRVARGWIGARERGARFDELFVAEKPETIVEGHRVDPIRSDRRAQTAADLGHRARLRGVQPRDEARIDRDADQAERADERVRHPGILCGASEKRPSSG